MLFGILKRLRALPIVIVRLRHQIGLYFDLIAGILASFIGFWLYYRYFVVQVSHIPIFTFSHLAPNTWKFYLWY